MWLMVTEVSKGSTCYCSTCCCCISVSPLLNVFCRKYTHSCIGYVVCYLISYTVVTITNAISFIIHIVALSLYYLAKWTFCDVGTYYDSTNYIVNMCKWKSEKKYLVILAKVGGVTITLIMCHSYEEMINVTPLNTQSCGTIPPALLLSHVLTRC